MDLEIKPNLLVKDEYNIYRISSGMLLAIINKEKRLLNFSLVSNWLSPEESLWINNKFLEIIQHGDLYIMSQGVSESSYHFYEIFCNVRRQLCDQDRRGTYFLEEAIRITFDQWNQKK